MSAWPDPQATALDRAHAIARTYRDTLARVAPDACARIDQAAVGVGEGWVCGATTGEKSCTVAQAAHLLGVTERRVRQLIDAQLIRSSGKAYDGHVLLVQDVLTYRAHRTSVSRCAG